MKDEDSLETVIRLQHIVDAKVKWSPLKSPNVLHNSMKNKFDVLTSLNTIVVDDVCHHDIIEELYTRSHLEHSEYYNSSDDSISSDVDTDDEI